MAKNIFEINNPKEKLNNENTLSIEELFALDCYPIDARREYGEEYRGPRWIIASDLSKQEIAEKYQPLIEKYGDYLLVKSSIGEVIRESNKTLDRLNKYSERKSLPYEEDFSESVFTEIRVSDYVSQLEEAENQARKDKWIRDAFNKLTETQKKRIIKHYVQNRTFCQIAEEEGVHFTAIQQSVEYGKKRLLRNLRLDSRYSSHLSKLLKSINADD